MKKLLGAAALLVAIISTLSSAAAQGSWPNRPIRLVVPVAAGGGFDIVARVLADGLSRHLPERVIVENQGGAGGLIAARAVAKGDADGYTFLFTGPSHASVPFVSKNPGYDVRKDFAAVSLVVRYPLVFVTNASNPAKTLKEFLDLAKASPGKYSYGSSGIGGTSHIPLAFLALRAGVDMVHVPFRGSGQTNAALLAGQIDLTCDGLANQLSNIREGRVKALGVSEKERVPTAPDIPTMSETIPGYEFPIWAAVFAPSATPPDIVEKMSKAIGNALKDPATRQRYETLQVEPVGSTAKFLDEYVKSQLGFYEDIIRKTNISTD